MSELKLTAGALPYSDGSGDQVRAIIERTDEGVMLRIEMTHRIPIDDWEKVRETIDALVYGARRMSNAQNDGSAGTPTGSHQ